MPTSRMRLIARGSGRDAGDVLQMPLTSASRLDAIQVSYGESAHPVFSHPSASFNNLKLLPDHGAALSFLTSMGLPLSECERVHALPAEAYWSQLTTQTPTLELNSAIDLWQNAKRARVFRWHLPIVAYVERLQEGSRRKGHVRCHVQAD